MCHRNNDERKEECGGGAWRTIAERKRTLKGNHIGITWYRTRLRSMFFLFNFLANQGLYSSSLNRADKLISRVFSLRDDHFPPGHSIRTTTLIAITRETREHRRNARELNVKERHSPGAYPIISHHSQWTYSKHIAWNETACMIISRETSNLITVVCKVRKCNNDQPANRKYDGEWKERGCKEMHLLQISRHGGAFYRFGSFMSVWQDRQKSR